MDLVKRQIWIHSASTLTVLIQNVEVQQLQIQLYQIGLLNIVLQICPGTNQHFLAQCFIYKHLLMFMFDTKREKKIPQSFLMFLLPRFLNAVM